MAAQSSRLKHLLPPFVLLYLLLLASYHFMDRVPIYHDEIINTYNGSVAQVFTYAVRPLYYALNTFFIQHLGTDVKSLQLSGLIYFVASGYLVFALCSSFSAFCGLVALIFYSLFANQWWLSIQGIPNAPLSTIILLVAFAWVRLQPINNSWLKQVILGILAFLPGLMHPTGIGFVAGFTVSICLAFFLTCRFKHAIVACLYFGLGQAVVLAITNIAFKMAVGTSYLGFWMQAVNKVQVNQQFEIYHQPQDFYLKLIWSHYSLWILLPILLIIIILVTYIFNRFSGRRSNSNTPAAAYNENYAEQPITAQSALAVQAFLILSTSALISLLFISLASWKFDRVLIALSPLFAVNIALALHIFTNDIHLNYRNAIRAVLLIAIVIFGVTQFQKQPKHLIKISANKYYGHQAIIDYLRSLSATKIGYFGSIADHRRTTLFGAPSRKAIEFLDIKQFVELDSSQFVHKLDSLGIASFIVNKNLPKQQRRKLLQAATTPFCHLAYSYIGLYQVWHCRKHPLGNAIIKRLSLFSKGTQIWLLKSKNSTELTKLLRSHQLTASHLAENDTEKLAGKGFNYLLLDQSQVNSIQTILPSILERKYHLVASDTLLDHMGDAKEFYLYRRKGHENIF